MRRARPTLSFCITTRGPADRVRVLLEHVRPHVDEIVLACDRRGGIETLELCGELADRTLLYELSESPAQLVGWILHQCSCDWILRLDDDESPSHALLEALPELIADRRTATAVALLRRWLYPTPERYIAQWPWGTEPQTRLLRNLPSLWTFDGKVHTEGAFLADWALRDLPIYHLDLLLPSLERRRAKRVAYEKLRPDIAWSGFRLNDMYLPEEHGQLETLPVPAVDQELLGRMLGPPRAQAREPCAPAAAEFAGSAEIASCNLKTVEHGRAQLAFRSPRGTVSSGVWAHFDVEVRNLGEHTWPWGDAAPHVRLGWRWLTPEGKPAAADEGRTLFREAIPPHVDRLVHVSPHVPEQPGDYLFEVDVVHENRAWFQVAVSTPVTVISSSALVRAERDQLLRHVESASVARAVGPRRRGLSRRRP